MDLTLKLNARFQPKHRHELEDVLLWQMIILTA